MEFNAKKMEHIANQIMHGWRRGVIAYYADGNIPVVAVRPDVTSVADYVELLVAMIVKLACGADVEPIEVAERLIEVVKLVDEKNIKEE